MTPTKISMLIFSKNSNFFEKDGKYYFIFNILFSKIIHEIKYFSLPIPLIEEQKNNPLTKDFSKRMGLSPRHYRYRVISRQIEPDKKL